MDSGRSRDRSRFRNGVARSQIHVVPSAAVSSHLGFEVEDIDAFSAELPDEAEPLSEPQEIDIGIEILFFRDPDGNFVEVLEG